MTYTTDAPLPIRFPATDPPVAGDHIDIGAWSNGWRFLTDVDRERFDSLNTDEQRNLTLAFEGMASGLAER